MKKAARWLVIVILAIWWSRTRPGRQPDPPRRWPGLVPRRAIPVHVRHRPRLTPHKETPIMATQNTTAATDEDGGARWCPWTPPAPPAPPRWPVPCRHGGARRSRRPVLGGRRCARGLDEPDYHGAASGLAGAEVRRSGLTSPAAEHGDWLADLATRARERRPIIPPWLRSRREALATLAVGRGALPACVRVPRGPCPEVRGQARSPHPARSGPARGRDGAVDVRPGRPPGADGRGGQGRPGGVPEAVPAAGRAGPAAGVDRWPGRLAVVLAGAVAGRVGPPLARWAAARPGA